MPITSPSSRNPSLPSVHTAVNSEDVNSEKQAEPAPVNSTTSAPTDEVSLSNNSPRVTHPILNSSTTDSNCICWNTSESRRGRESTPESQQVREESPSILDAVLADNPDSDKDEKNDESNPSNPHRSFLNEIINDCSEDSEDSQTEEEKLKLRYLPGTIILSSSDDSAL
jgi:hypothetical protein